MSSRSFWVMPQNFPVSPKLRRRSSHRAQPANRPITRLKLNTLEARRGGEDDSLTFKASVRVGTEALIGTLAF